MPGIEDRPELARRWPAGSDLPDALPPEFEQAYRAAYADALGASGTGARAGSPPPAPAHAEHRRPVAAELSALWQASWVKAALAGVAAIVLVLGAYAAGRALSHGSAEQPAAGETAAAPAVYAGRVVPIKVTSVVASCTAPPGVDAGGHRVTYRPENTVDDDLSTAWRCDGRGVGETLTFSLPARTRVVRLGLVPGYAKTDPVSGVDRYAQNNLITRVRWTLGGRQVVQRLSADPRDRSLRSVRLAAGPARRVRLEVLATRPGPRDTTAISAVAIGAPAS